jgi:dipeptidyl aminopeptidase/acylaminoacyl peptidase
LIIHGAKDTAVAPFLADELFVGLRRLGKVVTYAKYEGEGHQANGYRNQLDIANRMIAWFEKYLKGDQARPVP